MYVFIGYDDLHYLYVFTGYNTLQYQYVEIITNLYS